MNLSVFGRAFAKQRATGASPEIGHAVRVARCAKRKASVVLELPRGAGLESTSRKYGATATTLTEWRDAFLAGGAEALKVRQEALVRRAGPAQEVGDRRTGHGE